MRAILLKVAGDVRLFVNDHVLDHSDLAGTDAGDLVDDLGLALSDDLEGHVVEDAALAEVITGLVRSGEAESVSGIVGNSNCTLASAADNRHDLFVLIFLRIKGSDDLELGLVIVYVGLELGELAFLAALSLGQAGHVQLNSEGESITNVCIIVSAIPCVTGLAAISRSLGGVGRNLGGVGGSLGSGLVYGSGIIGLAPSLDLVVVAILLVNGIPAGAVFDTGSDVNCLNACAVEDQALSVSSDLSRINILVELVGLNESSGGAGPIGAACPVVSVYVLPIQSIGEVNSDHFFLIGSSLISCALVSGSLIGSSELFLQIEVEHVTRMICGAALFALADLEAIEPIFGTIAVGTEVHVVHAVLLDIYVVIHTIRIPVANSCASLVGDNSLDHVGSLESHVLDDILIGVCDCFVLCHKHIVLQTPAGD